MAKAWSAPLLFASTEDRVSRVEAHFTVLTLPYVHVDVLLGLTQMNQRRNISTFSTRWFGSV